MPYWRFKGWTFSCHKVWQLDRAHARALSDVMAIIQNKLQRATTPMKNTSIRMRSVIATILTIVCIQSDLALGYMGAKDKNDWSQGPSCSAQDSKNPNLSFWRTSLHQAAHGPCFSTMSVTKVFQAGSPSRSAPMIPYV